MKQKVISFATQGKNDDSVSQRQRNSTSCPSCSLDHDLDSCKQFLHKNPYGRKMFVMSKKLCFGCYAPDHNIKNFPKKRIGKKEGCGSDHPTGLHRSLSRNERISVNQNPREVMVKSVHFGHIHYQLFAPVNTRVHGKILSLS